MIPRGDFPGTAVAISGLQMRPGPIAVQTFVLAGVLCARAGAQTVARDPIAPIARLVGVDLDSDPAALVATARAARVKCGEAPRTPDAASAERTAYVCDPPPIAVPFPATATYWYESGTLARVYLVSAGASTQFADYLSGYEGTILAWSWALGAPVWRSNLPGDWTGARPLPDALRLQAIAAGRVTLAATWQLGTTKIEVRLYGEGGLPKLMAMIMRGDGATGCSPQAIRDAVFDLFPPASEAKRTASARHLGACHVRRAAGALESARARDLSAGVRAEALAALTAIRQPTPEEKLAPITPVAPAASPAPVASAASPAPAPSPAPVASAASPAPVAVPASPTSVAAAASPSPVAPTAPVVPLPVPSAEPANEAPPQPWTGTPLAIGASTVAGAALMRNLGLMGGQGLSDVTPQLLLGTAGAVIGFGTSWGLSRFGFKPTVEQAAWFANLTAWGTLEGVTLWSASNSTNPKLEYGAFALGEATGMGLGVFSAHGWNWTAPQIALADGMLVGAVLPAIGIPLINDQTPQIEPLDAIALPAIMVGAAIAAHQMDPTANDLHLMTFGALAGGWTGALLASGATGTGFLSDRPSAGGLMAGAGFGFLGATAAGAFSETDGARLGIASVGLVAGDVLGFGLHQAIAGFAHADGPGGTFTAVQANRWALGAGAGGIVLGAAAYAYAPKLHLGPSATAMTVEGALYGAGTWALALEAGAHAPATEVDQARLTGGLLAGAMLGGVGGLVSSRWFAPDDLGQATTAATTTLGMAGGLGVARLAIPNQGLADAMGVMLGAGVGFTGGALVAHGTRLRGPDFGAGFVGAGFGALVGTLAPTLGDAAWDGGRAASGGAWLGLALGGAGAAAAAHFADATGGEVGVATVGTTLGLGVGIGAGLLDPCETDCTSRAPRIGAVAGVVGGLGLGLLGEWRLHLSGDVYDAAPTFGLLGATFGIADGLMLAAAVAPSGTTEREQQGGVLMAGSAELAVGLLASRLGPLPNGGAAVLTGGKIAGAFIGLGTSMLTHPDGGRADPLAMLGGSLVGLGGAIAAEKYAPLSENDGAGLAVGAAIGGVIGTLGPTLGDDSWEDTSARRRAGGLLIGTGVGAVVGAALRHETDATAAAIAVPTVGATLGLGIGLGAGLLDPCDSDCTSQAPRIGAVAGIAGGLGLGLLGEWRLHLSSGLGDAASTYGLLGASFGVADGLMLAAAVAPSGTTAREQAGGILLAGSAELGLGMLAGRLGPLPSGGAAVLTGGKLAGAFIGLGTSMLARTDGGRADPLMMLGGSLAGLGGAIATETHTPLTETDGGALALGAAAGGLLGTLSPTLGDDNWDTASGRQRAGGLLLGTGLGAVASVALRHDTDASPSAVGLTAIGGAEGLVTGLGFGLSFESGDASRAERIGSVAGTVAGLGMGALVWPRLAFDDVAPTLTVSAGALGGWTGAWLPLLGHADSGDVAGREIAGGLLAGAGLSTAGALLLDPVLRPQPDLIENALVLDAIWTGAGAGIGALASTRDDAPVWGMLTAGTAGLVLGGALHNSIAITDADAPHLTLMTAEGLWLGGWLPNAIWNPSEVSARERLGGLAAGGFGGLGLAALAGSGLELTPGAAGYTGLGSALGAALGGGIALGSPELRDRRGVDIMLGGSVAGLVAGAAFAPDLALTDSSTAAGATVVGGTLGAAESLLFAWSGRAPDSASYGGAALVGGSIGATLGLVATATPVQASGNVPAAAGFGAWGAWTGSFAGALVQNDPHDVVLGGLIGANSGFLAGYTLLRTGAVDPRDFGWLSLFGALGTVAGAGAGAPFASRTDPAPVLAGLALGPAVGMACGGLLLPKLRRLANRPSSVGFRDLPARTLGGFSLTATPGAAQAGLGGRELLSSDIIADDGPPFLRRLQAVVDVTEWSPLIGALPTPDQVGSPPLLFGVTGRWK